MNGKEYQDDPIPSIPSWQIESKFAEEFLSPYSLLKKEKNLKLNLQYLLEIVKVKCILHLIYLQRHEERQVTASHLLKMKRINEIDVFFKHLGELMTQQTNANINLTSDHITKLMALKDNIISKVDFIDQSINSYTNIINNHKLQLSAHKDMLAVYTDQCANIISACFNEKESPLNQSQANIIKNLMISPNTFYEIGFYIKKIFQTDQAMEVDFNMNEIISRAIKQYGEKYDDPEINKLFDKENEPNLIKIKEIYIEHIMKNSASNLHDIINNCKIENNNIEVAQSNILKCEYECKALEKSREVMQSALLITEQIINEGQCDFAVLNQLSLVSEKLLNNVVTICSELGTQSKKGVVKQEQDDEEEQKNSFRP